MKKIVLFVEGEGEADAAPLLVKKLINEIPEAWQSVTLDLDPFRVGEVNRLLKANSFQKKLRAANCRGEVGGVIVLLDGDVKVEKNKLCAAKLGVEMAQLASEVGAGSTFSVAVVFALQEFESWLIASYESIGGNTLPDGREIPMGKKLPDDVELAPRDAKKWWKECIGKYKPSLDQAELTKLFDPDCVRKKKLRSFTRLESAVSEIVAAIKSGNHVSSPAVYE